MPRVFVHAVKNISKPITLAPDELMTRLQIAVLGNSKIFVTRAAARQHGQHGELIVYDRRNDSLVDKKAGQMFHDAYHPRGTASALAKTCFDQVIKATKLRELIMAIRQ